MLNIDMLLMLPMIIVGLVLLAFALKHHEWFYACVNLMCLCAIVAFVVVRAWYIWDEPACWFAPRVVEYHAGMTLCPGQSAHLQLMLPSRSPGRDHDI